MWYHTKTPKKSIFPYHFSTDPKNESYLMPILAKSKRFKYLFLPSNEYLKLLLKSLARSLDQ